MRKQKRPNVHLRKCSKCGEPLGSSENGICLFCKKESSPQERQDIESWKKREEEDW